MITLFENITAELTDLERERLVPMLKELLSKTSPENRFTSRKIVQWFVAGGYLVTKQRLSKMIAYLRVSNGMAPQVIIGAGNGYFVTDDPVTVREQIESLAGRVEAIRCVMDALQAQEQNLTHAGS